jgi:hypothetical protein
MLIDEGRRRGDESPQNRDEREARSFNRTRTMIRSAVELISDRNCSIDRFPLRTNDEGDDPPTLSIRTVKQLVRLCDLPGDEPCILRFHDGRSVGR